MPGREILSAAGVKGGQAPKHQWTEEERSIIRSDYKGTNASAKEIADAFVERGIMVTRHAIKGQVAKLGIMRQKSPPWTPGELERLEKLIHRHSVPQVAKKLHRSPNAVKIKATRLKLDLRLRFDWYTKKDVCEIVGEDHHKVQKWIDSGELKATWHNDRQPSTKGYGAWHIEAKDLKKFIIKHSGELLGRNVDIQQIVWLLTKID